MWSIVAVIKFSDEAEKATYAAVHIRELVLLMFFCQNRKLSQRELTMLLLDRSSTRVLITLVLTTIGRYGDANCR